MHATLLLLALHALNANAEPAAPGAAAPPAAGTTEVQAMPADATAPAQPASQPAPAAQEAPAREEPNTSLEKDVFDRLPLAGKEPYLAAAPAVVVIAGSALLVVVAVTVGLGAIVGGVFVASRGLAVGSPLPAAFAGGGMLILGGLVALVMGTVTAALGVVAGALRIHESGVIPRLQEDLGRKDGAAG